MENESVWKLGKDIELELLTSHAVLQSPERMISHNPHLSPLCMLCKELH